MRPTSIRQRLRFKTLAVLATLCAVFAVQQWTSLELERTFGHVERHEVRPEYLLRDMLSATHRVRQEMLERLLAQTESEFALQNLEYHRELLRDYWTRFKREHRVYREEQREHVLIKLVDGELPRVLETLDRMLAAYRIYDPVDLTRIAREEWVAHDGGALLYLKELAYLQREHAQNAYRDLVVQFQHTSARIGLVMVACFLIVLLLSSLLNGHVNRQIANIERGLGEITGGRTKARVSGEEGTEFGRIASAINYTLDLLQKERDAIAALGRKTEAILASITEGIYGVGSDGRIIFANDAAHRALGYAPGELLDRPSHETLHHSRPDGRPYPAAQCPFLAARLGSQTIRGDDEFLVRRDGSCFPIEYTCTPLLGLAHEDAAIVVFRDITERREKEIELHRAYEELKHSNDDLKAAQGQLLQSEKMASIGQLAAGVAHEINNPVGFVNSNLGTLREYVDNMLAVIDAYLAAEAAGGFDEPARTRIGQARAKADLDYLRDDIGDLLRESQDGLARIKRIVSDLKDFSHVGEQEWQDADLNAGIESTLNVVWNELKYKAEVEKELGELPQVRCLAAQLNQVFMNILVNAAQAIEERGKITIRTALDGKHALIQIADTGKGMPPEVARRIFEPFFTTKPVGKGTGLGLSIAWDIIRKHAGRLEVDSTPGQGTTFTIRIPLAGPKDDADTPPDATPT